MHSFRFWISSILLLHVIVFLQLIQAYAWNIRPVAKSFAQITKTSLHHSPADADATDSPVDSKVCGPCPMAPKCSGAFKEKGCDGSGKIQGGIATIPILSWWPIKVYRPCPAYLQAGYVYRREGQTLEQVLFSEPSTKTKALIEERKRKEKQDYDAFKSKDEN